MTDAGRAGDAAVIGHRLRELRSERELSLRQLARLIGVSPSLLSQIENGRVSPSVETLYQLSSALGEPVASFFGAPARGAEGPASSGVWVVRGDERQRITLEHGVTWENLLPHEVPGIRFMAIRYPPGAHSGEHMLRHPGRDLFLVLSGQLTISVGFGRHVLEAGDSISFADFQPHHVRNDGPDEATAILCVVGDDAQAAHAGHAAAPAPADPMRGG